MDLATINTDKGNINISRATIEILIHLILRDIKGIVISKKNVFSKITETVVKNSSEESEKLAQEIRVEIKPDSLIVNLFLIINYGIRIPDLTWEIQTKIKEKIKEITGIEIDVINVHIQGIRYPRQYRSKKRIVAPEIFVKIF
ncbi:MAG: Asp23/Gls24 family envelope stress response protein [Candidatus Atribacteria bacterium]|nr:Asp23/Gls24 family envelope stress response protein [Candidatus Atribacteria bacterium]